MPDRTAAMTDRDHHVAVSLPRVTVLATGGTIAGQADEQGGYRSAVLGPEALLGAVPQLAGLARLQAEQIASVGSQNMSVAIWVQLAKRITTLFERGEADAVVVTHGTDTMEETAFFLSLVLPTSWPLVLTGAMRPAGAAGEDGPANLLHAVALASSPQSVGRGPLVLMNEQVYSAQGVQKISASSITAFAAPNGGMVGEVYGHRVMFRSPVPASQPALFSCPQDGQLPRVDILYAYADQDGAIVDAMVERGARGVILAGVGAGNATDAVMAALQRAAQQGVVVVRASRTGSGHVGRNGEVDDDARGFVAAGSLPPAKARVLLMLALAQHYDKDALHACFAQYA